MYLGEPRRPLLERVFWFGVMSLVMSLCGLQIYQLYSNWLSSRTILTLDNNKYGIWDLPFPAITFCSDIQLQHIDNRTLGDDVFNKETEDVINLLCNKFELYKNVTLKIIDSKNWEHVIKYHKTACKHLIPMLFWIQDEIYSPCDYIQPIITSYGLCYSINMIPHHQLLHDNYLQSTSFLNSTQADIIAKKNQTTWTPETGYSRNATPFDVPWRVTGDTVDNAVRLIFDLTNENLGDHCPKRESGLTLIVHSPADVPVGIQPTAYVTGSSMLSVALSLNIIRTSHKIKKWTPKLRNCYYQHEKKLKFFKIYTLHNCEMECRANNTFNVCGCNAYFQPRDPGVSVCGTESLECIRESSTIGYSIFKKTLNMSNNIKGCNCLPSCTSIQYEYETVEFFRNWTTNSTKPKLVLTEKSAVVLIYFKRKSVIDIQKTPLMPFNELLGNIGGLFGLFLGCSIISFFEILYFFVIRLYFDHRNRKKAKSKITPSFIIES
ncbi:pickpocket protein 28-like isoform X1 [Metopolophium dirhodum]|uniref:pickpocket protein 28-like isoform X1 n=2 Tax=Metopolophium dirhodum TaxID=44670 RepID=UPI00298F8E59|nr:pickpocket protein 28-like isoform X1 [Metopolophium dirhodum]